ncbi:phage holin family protein [Paenibacillus xanthanilyticus]|uniref:Phage holin family protein n=1 Tax=Paenibacillus xanthanilyticus TaxID=1783531 RepID=A0ABV8KA70_9BACL
MDWNVLQGLIDPSLVVVVAVCWVLGYILKQTPQVPDWSIIFIVTAFAIGAVILTLGLTIESVLQGILCGAVAVYGNQIIKQGVKGANEDDH